MPSTADNLLLNAKGFAMSAETLLLTGDDKHDLTILHLVAVSLELSFKAWIKFRGGTEAEIRGLKHYLDRAYVRSLELGLVDHDGKLKVAIDILSPVYSQNFTRYLPDTDGFRMLAPPSLVDVARSVVLAVEQDIWLDAAKGPPTPKDKRA